MKDQLESRMIDLLNEADLKLSEGEFEELAESIIDYIDEIARKKKRLSKDKVNLRRK